MKAGSINFEKDNFVDWAQDANAIDRKVRAFTFPPFQFAQSTLEWLHGVKVVLIEDTESEGGFTDKSPGSIIELTRAGYLRVATGRGILRIGKLDGKCPKTFIRSLSCQLHDILFQM